MADRQKQFVFEHNGETFTLEEGIECIALGIVEDIANKEKRVEDIVRDCTILNSLSNALLVIKK